MSPEAAELGKEISAMVYPSQLSPLRDATPRERGRSVGDAIEKYDHALVARMESMKMQHASELERMKLAHETELRIVRDAAAKIVAECMQERAADRVAKRADEQVFNGSPA